MIKRGLIDLSSLLWTQLLGGKDTEFGRKVMHEGKEVLINSALYGYEKAVAEVITVMEHLNLVPTDLIFVMEGKNSKADRQAIHPGYKAGRDKVPEQYEQFHMCKEQVMTAFLQVGSNVCWQDGGVEGDDVVGYLAQNLEGERWIISGDKDLAVMVGGDIHHYRSGKIDENPFGDFPHKYIPLWIALVGDSGDKIPGAKGFGPAKMEELILRFGEEGLALLENLITTKDLIKLEEDLSEMPSLQKIIDDQDGVYMSYALGKLMIKKVNTMRRPLEWRVGMVRSRGMCEDERLRKYAGAVRLVAAENYDEAMTWARKEIARSPYVALDIETSTPPESDEWLEMQGKDDGKVVDVFGSKLTSLQLTFGRNLQHTVYLPFDNVEEAGISNLTMKQVADFVDMVPRTTVTHIHNCAFELPICFMSWGEMWKDDPEWRGFIRNARDTAIASSYVNENRSRGLKSLSQDLLGYTQMTYDETVTKEYLKSEWNGIGKLLGEWHQPVGTGVLGKVKRGTGRFEMIESTDHYGDPCVVAGDEIMEVVDGEEIMDHESGPLIVKVQHKMNQLRAKQVLQYGADDTICTAAVANYFRIIMELEKTYHVYEEVETYPAYLTALSFVQGTNFSLESMRNQEEDDDAAYNAAAPVLRQYLIDVGFEGTQCPVLTELTPAAIKEAFLIITGTELKTMVRKIDKLAIFMEGIADDADEDTAGAIRLLAELVRHNNLEQVNKLVAQHFKGEPKLDLASPKQMKGLLYETMKMPIRIINDVTPIEKLHARDLNEAVKKFKLVRGGKSETGLTADELILLRKKARTDDTAIETALAFDIDELDQGAREALMAIGTMKRVMTRRSLFYKNYKNVLHWKDRRVHSSMNQCAAVTRRYSSSFPNLTQLPKKGEGVRFREHFKPHHKLAVVASEDFGSQELRLAAHESQDKNLLACYVGDQLRDVHSTTASGAMVMKWGQALVNDLYDKYGPDLNRNNHYELFVRLRKLPKDNADKKRADDLRKDSKNVVFASFYGGQAVKISETLVMKLEEAQVILDAKRLMFPGIDESAKRAEEDCVRLGYATTMMGARRHLREAITSDDKQAASRAARQAYNMRIQGSAAEMTKLAMARLWLSGAMQEFDVRFIAPIHDELVVSVHKDHAVDYLAIQHQCMTAQYADMTVPVIGSISLGKDFANQIETEDFYSPEKIREALNDIFKEKEAA